MKNEKVRHFLHFIKFFLCISIIFIIAYGLSSTLFYFTGDPPEIIKYLISGLIGSSFIFMILVYLERRHGNFHEDFYEELYSALDKIANGDFRVFIKNPRTNNHHSFSDIAARVNNMAKQLNSMEIMRQNFVSNVSHEIQSPLTSIKGFSVLLKNKNLSYEEQVSYLEIIELESQRLSKLSDNLLKLSALDSGSTDIQLNSYSLDKQLKNVILSMEPQWTDKNISFTIDIPPTMIVADEDLISQVWINLLNNSIKFSPLDGEISVSIANKMQIISVAISDKGAGISSENQKHIFERFYMADKSRKRDLGGNGLGLSIVKKIVDMHGGSISVESQINEGTLFIVSLPVHNTL